MSLSKTFYSPKVLHRKQWHHPDMTENLLTGTLNLNTNKIIPCFLGLSCLLRATTFNLRTTAIQPVRHPTCQNHLILLVWSTTSTSWMPSFERMESELTSPYDLTLQTQRIIARSLRRRRFSVSTFMAQVSPAYSITLLTHVEYTLPRVRNNRSYLESAIL